MSSAGSISKTTPPGDPVTDEELKAVARLVARFGRLTRGVHDAMPDKLHAQLHATGLGQRHCHALIALAMNGPTHVGQLADTMGLSPATVSQLVNELHRQGMVDRHEDDEDRRRMIVSVSAKQRPLIKKFLQRRLEPLRHTLDMLGPKEREHFVRGLHLLIENLEKSSSTSAH